MEHRGYFERDNMYGYADDGERFAYFQKAVIEMLNQLNYFLKSCIVMTGIQV